MKMIKEYDIHNIPKGPISELIPLCRRVAAEGQVLLKNDDAVLPIQNEEVSVFGRCQLDYYKSGTGSGGLVNVVYKTNIIDSLLEKDNIKVNHKLADIYRDWVAKNPYDEGNGWEQPWSQKEMPLSDELVKEARDFSKKAIVVIGRTAGESRDNVAMPGSWHLSDGERQMLDAVTKYFSDVAVVLNVGNIIDMNWVEEYGIKSVLYIWHGGQEGGRAAADTIVGDKTPSGKLSDTIAKSIEDYPAYNNFADDEQCVYEEDIYVGYRYFETFAKDKVLYPFGFGLSYTTFEKICTLTVEENKVVVSAEVINTGDFSGKETIQVYFEAPQGLLGKPARTLVGFAKTKELAPGEKDMLTISFEINRMASFDDNGATGNKGAYVLEAGRYDFYVGTDVRSAKLHGSVVIDDLIVTEKTKTVLSPNYKFNRLKPKATQNGFEKVFEPVTQAEFDIENGRDIPCEIRQIGDVSIKLDDVRCGKCTMDRFIAQLSDDDLCHIVRGEGMSSPKVTPGTGCAFGGVTDRLLDFGIPTMCGTDGPSGIRMDSGAKATSLPIGTLIACTWDVDLIYEMFVYEGIELAGNKIDALLGPGMNIHRHPLNGRNFEYFSEDPILSGYVASAIANGISKSNVTAVIKHFAANNQEQKRNRCNSIVSERALREIYLKGFEIAVKNSKVKSVMTSYNRVNGVWSANNTALVTGVLRNEWCFDGFVMTDWWADMNPEEGDEATKQNMIWFAQSQNDIYMVSESAEAREDNLKSALENGKVTRAELQRNAKNICNFAIGTNALDRFLKGDYIRVGELTKHADELDTKLRIDGYNGEVKFELEEEGMYLICVEAKAKGDELQQSKMRVCINQGPIAMTVKGGDYQKFYREMYMIKGRHKIGLDLPDDVEVKYIKILK